MGVHWAEHGAKYKGLREECTGTAWTRIVPGNRHLDYFSGIDVQPSETDLLSDAEAGEYFPEQGFTATATDNRMQRIGGTAQAFRSEFG